MCRDTREARGNPELVHLLGEKCVGLDVNSMKPLDNLCHPVSVIREAEELAADAFGAANAFSYGRGHHLSGAGHDFVHLQGRRQDYTSEKCS